MFDLGAFIKEKRESANLSQKKLGSICGVSDSAIHNIETGKTKSPGWEILCKIAKATGFHPLEAMKAAGYIIDEDINPCFTLRNIEKLKSDELNTVQLFVDFILYQRIRATNKEDC